MFQEISLVALELSQFRQGVLDFGILFPARRLCLGGKAAGSVSPATKPPLACLSRWPRVFQGVAELYLRQILAKPFQRLFAAFDRAKFFDDTLALRRRREYHAQRHFGFVFSNFVKCPRCHRVHTWTAFAPAIM